jgi:hypothetical protein
LCAAPTTAFGRIPIATAVGPAGRPSAACSSHYVR